MHVKQKIKCCNTISHEQIHKAKKEKKMTCTMNKTSLPRRAFFKSSTTIDSKYIYKEHIHLGI